MPRNRNEVVLQPVRPSLALELEYRRKLVKLVDDLHDSVSYWIQAAYRQNEPRIARDEMPADALREAIQRLIRRWKTRLDKLAPKLAAYFSRSVEQRSTAALRNTLKKAGWTVEFKMTPVVRDVVKATVYEQVNLIKSIPSTYLTRVESLVMQSVQSGRKLDELSRELQRQFGVTKRRAAFIAHNQNNVATAAITKARQLEAGIERAIWMHSHAGKEPRKSHAAAGARKQVYDVRTGWFDPDENRYIWPGVLPNCRCTSRPVIGGRVPA